MYYITLADALASAERTVEAADGLEDANAEITSHAIPLAGAGPLQPQHLGSHAGAVARRWGPATCDHRGPRRRDECARRSGAARRRAVHSA
jgi:hypothetical protein